MHGARPRAGGDAPDTAARVRFVRDAAGGDAAELRETHMSWVAIGAEHVLKLKKPVRYPFLDFATVRAREHACREELRLNRRLAPDVYRGVLALTWRDGELALVPADHRPPPLHTVDWVVLMRRLPDARMMDRVIADGRLRAEEVAALADVLVGFYGRVPRAVTAPADHRARLEREQAVNRRVLLEGPSRVTGAEAVVGRMDEALAHHGHLLEARAREGRIVDGHGDLRPEHVCLLDPPVVIDCLEFNAALRAVDPVDELCLLGLECARAGAAWVGPLVRRRYAAAAADAPPPELVDLYTAYRGVLRARLAAAHLRDPAPRTPGRWPGLAREYLALASPALARLGSPGRPRVRGTGGPGRL